MKTALIIACLSFVAAAGPSTDTGSGPRLEPYVASSKLYGLYKPGHWKVNEDARPDAFRIAVASPMGTSQVEFRWERNRAGRPDALSALVAWHRALAQAFPGAALSDVFVTPDATRAVATVRYRLANTSVQGRYFFESSRAGNASQGYLAPEAQLGAARPLLLNMMSSLAFVKVLHRGESALLPPVKVPLVGRQAQDRSLTMRTPADWAFLAGGGRVVTGAPGLGFIFTAFAGNPMLPGATISQGVIGTPYRSPAQALALMLVGFGNRNPTVVSSTPDADTMAQCRVSIGNRCEAADLVAQWTSPEGVGCVGAFKVVNTVPGFTGQWSSIVAGLWGPQKDFYRYYPLLEQVAESFSINDRYARGSIEAGLANLKRLQQQTAAAIQDLNRAREDNQAAWEAKQARKDYMDSKWDDYRRGQSYWVSELEGGRAYATDTSGTRDTSNGDYYAGHAYNWTNFEGQNPRYPSETMREVTSYELEHGRVPP